MIFRWFLRRLWWGKSRKWSNGSGSMSNGSGCMSNQSLVCRSCPRSSEGHGKSWKLFFWMTLHLQMEACHRHCSSVKLARVIVIGLFWWDILRSYASRKTINDPKHVYQSYFIPYWLYIYIYMISNDSIRYCDYNTLCPISSVYAPLLFSVLKISIIHDSQCWVHLI